MDKEIYNEFWLDLASRYSFELIKFAFRHDIALIPGYGYFTIKPGPNEPTMRAVLMSIQDSDYHDWDLAQELGHFWPTRWVLDNLTSRFYCRRTFLYSLCELWHWLMGWLILKKLKLPTSGYWNMARDILRNYHQPKEIQDCQWARHKQNIMHELEGYKARYGEAIIEMILQCQD